MKGSLQILHLRWGLARFLKKAKRILEVTQKALEIGISTMIAGNHLGDIGAAVEQYVRSYGLFVTHTYTGPRCRQADA